jgi:hypothetical protein
MAIEFNCPHCAHQYRLKDEMAGKSAICKTCRNKITIPQPVPVPDNKPLSAEAIAAAEAAALAALNDDPTPAEQNPADRVIDIECNFCNHKWTEPYARAGKNTLCPNPECRQRIRIPEPKDDGPVDWRQKRSKLPEGAKQNFEKLEGVQDAAELKQVSGETIREKILEDDTEPRPLKQKIMFALAGVAVLAGLVFGVMSLLKSRTAGKEDRLMQESQDEFAQALPALEHEATLCTALLHAASGEHAVRHDDPKKLKEALEQFGKAREALRPPKTPASFARNVVCGELAVAVLSLGGTEQQARDQIRIRWFPEANSKTRPNERVYTVLDELRQTLTILQGAEFEFKQHLARRLTRELAKRGQAQLAVELIPLALFNQSEWDEAKAIIGIEVYRADKNSEHARKVADDLKSRGADLLRGNPTPASASMLFTALGTEKAPSVVGAPAGNPVADASRYAFTGRLLLEDKASDAIALALRPGSPEAQIRALTLCADWSADPGAALDAAIAIVTASKTRKDVNLSPYAVVRLAQIAAEKGRHDLSKQFAEAIADEGLRAWAKGSSVQSRLAASPKEKGDEAWAELPDDPKKMRAGYLWGRLALARQNSRISGDRSGEVRTVTSWPTLVTPFGKAGVALGLQDRDK